MGCGCGKPGKPKPKKITHQTTQASASVESEIELNGKIYVVSPNK
jgi:hypothetical protein